MTDEEFKNLERGDIVRHVHHSDSLVVEGRLEDHVFAVRVLYVTNPKEWVLVNKAQYQKTDPKCTCAYHWLGGQKVWVTEGCPFHGCLCNHKEGILQINERCPVHGKEGRRL